MDLNPKRRHVESYFPNGDLRGPLVERQEITINIPGGLFENSVLVGTVREFEQEFVWTNGSKGKWHSKFPCFIKSCLNRLVIVCSLGYKKSYQR
jgi:hypothetical protein